MTPLRQRMLDALVLRGMAARTQESYIEAVSRLARHYRRSPESLTAEQVQQYLLHLVRERHLARASVNQYGCAFRFLYGTVLGLPFVKQWGDMPGFEYQAGDLTIAIMDPTAFGQEFRPNAGMVAFAVDDVAAARAALEAEGVQFVSDMIDSGVCHQAIFLDPSGNPLDLHHRYAPNPD